MRKRKFKEPGDVRKAYPSERRGSPYWAWCARHRGSAEDGRIIEPLRADPSRIPEPVESEPGAEFAAIVSVLNDGAKNVLTTRQWRAIKLVLIEGLTHKQAAGRMAISRQSVTRHVKAGARILRKMCLERMAADDKL